MDDAPSFNYRDAGVDIAAGGALVERIAPAVQRTHRPGVLAGLGGFGGLFELPIGRYRQPVLVSGTDGVGTKLKLAQRLNRHDTIGIDLVAMCVNDILVSGAEPLFFLDYYASGHLRVGAAATVIQGIAAGCEQAGCALIGGETAEMPGLYAGEDYDLAGFAVGVVEKEALLGAEKVRIGDALLGLAASGPHSNGYSLIRKLLEITAADLEQDLDGRSLGAALLTPTRIYVKSLLLLLKEMEIHALAHITGGGLIENVPRVLPVNSVARIDLNSWKQPAVFRWIQAAGNVTETEMLRTFNCGVGMVLALPAALAEPAIVRLNILGECAWHLGQVEAANGEPTVQFCGLAFS